MFVMRSHSLSQVHGGIRHLENHLYKSSTSITFVLNEIRFVISDIEHIKLTEYQGRHKDFYHFGHHEMIILVDKDSGDRLKTLLS